jgi:hypothetical protein
MVLVTIGVFNSIRHVAIQPATVAHNALYDRHLESISPSRASRFSRAVLHVKVAWLGNVIVAEQAHR